MFAIAVSALESSSCISKRSAADSRSDASSILNRFALSSAFAESVSCLLFATSRRTISSSTLFLSFAFRCSRRWSRSCPTAP
jgi:hypothetical protein